MSPLRVAISRGSASRRRPGTPVGIGELGDAASALVCFALGPPARDPGAIALHRALAGRAWSPDVPLTVLGEAAISEQVAVLTHALVPATRPLLAEAAARLLRRDALLELGLAHAARALGHVAAPSVAPVAPVALMKGSAAIGWAYESSAMRERRDLDLLVADALPEVRRALLAAGWRDANDPRHGPDPTRVRAWNMSLALGGGSVSLDLHRHLVHQPWCRPDVPSMLARRVPGRALLPVTDPADTWINTAIHLLGTGFHEPLKGWIDLLRLLPLVPPTLLAARAHAHHLVTGAWVCLGVLGRWFEAPVDDHRAALGRPPQAALLEHLAAGEHHTPERRPLPRGVSYRLWPRLVRDLPRR